MKLKWIITLFFLSVNVQMLSAQTKADVFDPSKPVTWLGIDFSQAKFSGPHSTDAGLITNEQFRDNYTTSWNQLFVDEQKKYDVAKAVHRTSVKYAIDVTAKANKALNKEFFVENPSDAKMIDEATVSAVVKNYDFQGNDGIGLMFIVDAMSKGQELVSMWITFVDMKSKKVLFTIHETGKVGGFGFRNYYAKPFALALKDINSDFDKWKKL